ncbi:MAG: hypothetical protein Q9165_007269 [Trypethelium subeluteriae]
MDLVIPKTFSLSYDDVLDEILETKSPRVGSQAVRHTQDPRSVCDLIETWARKDPNHTAIICEEGRRVSYRELNDAACRIAVILLEKRVRQGDLIPVLATRSPEMIATFLGILKAGCCYVPIDIEAWSEDRIVETIRRVSPHVVVNLGPTRDLDCYTLPGSKVEDALKRAALHESISELPQYRIQPEDLAYIIFTSGTTSTPKGVMIPHRALLNYVEHGTEEAPFNANAAPEDVALLIFSPGFDACTGLVFSTLCSGAQVMIPSSANFLSCVPLVTVLTATPSVLAAIQEPEACPRLRTIILGGEAPPPALIRKWWAPGRNVYNAYGPTETTICSLMGRVYPDKPITLGLAMPNSHVALFDGDTESDQGEICISGPGLALGYYQDEVRTAKAFVSINGERMYRTGDFARRTEHGLEFGGRADSLVKNRGFLVNLESEVIPILLQAGAATATAFMHQSRLMAFVTPSSLDAQALRQSLSANHDAFLTPDTILAMDSLPLTANGKTDNRVLLQRLEKGTFAPSVSNDESSSLDADEPRMAALKAAIAHATSRSIHEISGAQTFWELGGNSLAALKVLSFLRTQGYKLPIKALFELPNLGAVSDALEADETAGTSAEVTTTETQPVDNEDAPTAPMSSLQIKMIEASLRKPGANYLQLKIDIPHPGSDLDRIRFKSAWSQVLQRHSIFRTVYLLQEEQQQIRPDLELDWREEETSKDQMEAVVRQRSSEMRDKMLRADAQSQLFVPVHAYSLITVPEVGSTLLISAHHAQADGWSLSIVLEEVQRILDGKELPQSGPQFANAVRSQKQQETRPEAVSFWKDALKDHAGLPQLSLPKPPPETLSSDFSESLEVRLGCDSTQLQDAARRLRVMPSSLIYAAWALLLSSYTSTDHVAFGAVFSGRNLPDVRGIEQVVGPLLNTVPFPITLNDQQQSTIAEMVSVINSRLLQMVESQWSASEAMASMTSGDINRLFQSIVVTEYDLPPLSTSWVVERQDMMEFGLSLLIEKCDPTSEDLRARVLFDGALYAQSCIVQLLSQFKNALRELMSPQNVHIEDIRAKLMDEEMLQLLTRPAAALVDGIGAARDGPRTVKDAFETAASQWPDLPAVESDQYGSMTYRELDQASNRIAQWLRASLPEIKRPQDVVVGVLADGSVHWIVAILAAFKAGCICCAIDLKLPSQRIDTIVEQSGASVFLAANQRCSTPFEHLRDVGTILVVDDFLKNPSNASAAQLDTLTGAKDTVYLVFTSGSTGVPKGKHGKMTDLLG